MNPTHLETLRAFQAADSFASGERFAVEYLLEGDEKEALARAKDICIEQTVEFPEDLLPDGFIRAHVLGKIENFKKTENGYEARIAFPIETAAGELTQLLNVIFGNISLKPGIFLRRLDLPSSIQNMFPGPRYGINGLRKLLDAPACPLLATALKPMGLTPRGLADLAYRFALGGIDIIKDDHGLTDQPYAPFEERVTLCAEAVQRANRETGLRCIYAANITCPDGLLMERASFAKDRGAGAVMIAPGLTGFDAMKRLAGDEGIGLPVICHPAFLGSFVMGGNGISHHVIFGTLPRLSGADASIYPNFGGRFSFSRDECHGIVSGCLEPMGDIASIFPAPGGGMTMENIRENRDFYGPDVIYLMGGGLFRESDDLTANCRRFREFLS